MNPSRRTCLLLLCGLLAPPVSTAAHLRPHPRLLATDDDMAVAIGLDWLHHDLTDDQRSRYRDALLVKAITTARREFDRKTSWTRISNYWSQVCGAGIELRMRGTQTNAALAWRSEAAPPPSPAEKPNDGFRLLFFTIAGGPRIEIDVEIRPLHAGGVDDAAGL